MGGLGVLENAEVTVEVVLAGGCLAAAVALLATGAGAGFVAAVAVLSTASTRAVGEHGQGVAVPFLERGGVEGVAGAEVLIGYYR